MSTITLPNIRVSSDLTVKLKLKDGGVALDWSTLQNIKVGIHSDAQRAKAGNCGVSIDAEDPTLLVCTYAANKPQYLGVNRIIVTAKYMGETKTYDKPAFNFVRWTDDQAGEQITIDDPDVDVEIEVQDISSSILQEAVDEAFTAADRANDAAAAAEHMVDIHTGPEGKSAYEVAVEEGYTGTEEEWLASLKGDTGETPDISIGTVTTVAPGTPASASMTGTPEEPVLNLSIPQGVVGATPNFTVGTVTTGEPGSSVIVTITGTSEAPVLNLTIPQGMQGNTGSSVEFPYELVNNLTTNDATKGLSAAQGVVLDGKVSQLEAKVTDLKDGLNGGKITLSGWNDGQYITTNQNVGDVCPKAVTTNASWRSVIVAITPNITKFVVNGEGGSSPRLWCFLDADDKVLSRAEPSVSSTGDALELIPPTGATQLIINSKNSEDCYKYATGVLPTMQEELSGVIAESVSLNERTTAIEDEFSGVQPLTITDFSSFETIDFYITAEGNWRSASSPHSVLIPATKYRGKKISIVANENNNSLFAFLKGETITPVNGNPAPLCVGETGSYGITAGGNTFDLPVPNDCDWFCVATIVSSTNRTPQSIHIPGEDGMTDKVDFIAEQTENESGLPISFDGSVSNSTISLYGKIGSSLSTGLAIHYKQFAKDTILKITIKCFSTTDNSRGRIGYVDSVSDIVVGNFVKSVISQDLHPGDESTVEYFVPAGKVLVAYKNAVDVLFAYPEKKIIRTTEKFKNIINGSYSWWTAPHTERKVLGNTDKTIVAYTKNTGELCVAIRDNNTFSYDEKVLMISASIDDHNAPACSFLSDGRIIVACALGHHDGPNQYIFISANPFDINSFVEKVFTTEGDCTYSRMIIHGGYIFLFWREEISGVSYWHGVYSTDEFDTNSGEFDFIRQSYVYLEKTTDPDYIKIYPCGHPTENADELDAIRSGYIKLSTMEILKGDGVTKVANLGTFVDNTDFDILVDATSTSRNRMLDAAITPVGVDRFVYAKGNPSSNPYDAKYYYYNNGTIIEIAPTGEPFYTASKYVGGAIIARQNNDVLIVARQDSGVWKLERYQIKNGAVDSVSLLDYSDAYIMRPLECGGCQYIYQKGGYNPSSFKDFATNIVFKDIVS